ncbi:hypothetical protein [Rhodopila sp.]|uniref:hypothetical protein n=1 Tax=Rhodopila sp. TaxID=2480087 RepID=UPI003D107F27
MDHDHVIHGLRRKRAEIAGRLEVAHAEISRLAVDLASIDGTIRMFSPHADLDEISPRKPPAPGGAMPGEISRIVMAALRDALGALSTRDVTLAVMAARGMPITDARLFEAMQKRVMACLRNLRIRGVVEKRKEQGKVMAWGLAA